MIKKACFGVFSIKKGEPCTSSDEAPRRSHKPTAAAAGHKKKGTPGAEPATKNERQKQAPTPS